MSWSLRNARDQRGDVVAVEALGGGLVEIGVRLPHLAATARPGQFAQVRCGETATPLLRRPFSVAWTEGEVVSFVLAAVGEGTRLLAGLRLGDTLTVLGPLGRGYTVDAAPARALCVCGGLGCAPFPLLVRALRARGTEVTVVNGAATATRLYPAERFRRGDGGVRVLEMTLDGSAGGAGVVTAALPGEVDAQTAVYGCGPNPMLAALARALDGRDEAPPLAEVSLEAPMGCGYGTCLGCALPVLGDGGASRWALCCREGPVMRMADVAWDELMALPPAHVA